MLRLNSPSCLVALAMWTTAPLLFVGAVSAFHANVLPQRNQRVARFSTPKSSSLRVRNNVSSETFPGPAAAVAAPAPAPASVPIATNSYWSWKGHSIYTQVFEPSKSQIKTSNPPFYTFKMNNNDKNKKKPTVVLIHGFGCSSFYWRVTVAALTEAGHVVHAIDLLGQGQSDKPGRAAGIEYSINLWAELVDDYIAQNIFLDASSFTNGVVLIGNSLGSVVALSTVTGDFSQQQQEKQPFVKSNNLCRGLCLFNCGIGMNSQAIVDEPQWNPLQRALLVAVFAIFNTVIFKNQLLLQYLLDVVVTRDLLRNALQGLYLSGSDRVDDALVESFYLPTQQEGAVEALSQIYTNHPGKTPQELYREHYDILSCIPIHVVWGDQDPVAPLSGPVGQFFVNLAQQDETIVTFEEIPNCGHIPFDDCPTQANGSMIQWIQNLPYDSCNNANGGSRAGVSYSSLEAVLAGFFASNKR